MHRIVSIADRPELVPVVARWLATAFPLHWQNAGMGAGEIEDLVGLATARVGVPQTFVAIANDRPVGTAGLIAADMTERPDLTPWLAGVFVEAAERGQGIASSLVRRVEAAAREAGYREMWLYTYPAEGLYLRLGWQTVERVIRGDKTVAVMRRDLDAADEAGPRLPSG